MSVSAFRDVLASTLDGIDDVRCGPYGFLTEKINPPAAAVDYEMGDRIVFGDIPEATFHVYLYHSRTSERSAQVFFDRHRDPTDSTSLWRVVEDADYGTAADYVRCRSASAIQAVDYGGAALLMVDFTLEVVL